MTPESSQDPARGRTPLAAETAPELVLRWLVPLRFIAATGQAVALLGAKFLLDLPLPYGSLALVPAVTALSNIALRRLTVEPGRARSLAGSALVLDTVLFTLLLQQSGGPDNPFSALYAIHVAMAAMLGSARVTWLVAALSAGGYACLFHWHEPQHFWHGPIVAGSSLQLHAVGMWLAVVIVAVVITFFIGRVTETLRLREAELRRISELAARNARLAALTTLAAGAAHELGSPLGTIAVIARDIEREAQSGLPLAEDARLLRSEVARCRAILDRMSGRAAQAAQGDDEPLLGRDVAALFSSAAFGEAAQRVVTELDASLDASLGGRADFAALVLPLVRNALDASSPDGSVRVSVSRTDGRVRVSVRDEGHGMSEQVLERAGEPFFTTRPPGRGTGLGLFVARLHAERLGGTLALDSAPGQGTSATAEWPAPYERA